MNNKTLPIKIINFIADDAWDSLQTAIGEVKNLQNNPLFLNCREGVGLDLQCLKESLIKTEKSLGLLRDN